MEYRRVVGFLFVLGFAGCFACSAGGNEPERVAMESAEQVGEVVSAIRATPETESECGVFAWEIRSQSQGATDGNGVAVMGFDRKGGVVFNQTIKTANAASDRSVIVEVTVPAAYTYEISESGERRDIVPAADPRIVSIMMRFASDMDVNKTDTSNYDACDQALVYGMECAAATASCAGAIIACPLAGYACARYGYCQTACWYGDASCPS